MPFPLEVCIDSLDAALAAAPHLRPGDRFEVCSSLLAGGGLTPSMGLVLMLRELMPEIKLMVMIRPRPGSFVYTPAEVDVMLEDIRAVKVSGAHGIVFGCLLRDGNVDVATAKRLAKAAHPLPVTFHRAFDVTPDWHAALEDIANIPGITRILTSGHMATALDGAAELRQLANFAPAHLSILPASGINAITLPRVLQIVPLHEAHLSAGGIYTPPTDPTGARGEVLGFGRSEWRLDPAKLAAVRDWVDKNT
ncbi:uncharacterized protein CcaverHIS019_0306210 [Cutaneotrichosporon cavernicola]|uniref:Copper homeostasis protein cutC homolog n=1 Tax=Cutaneotrichosporon cavernicola TaxID=279322 RepID=A0AA48I3P8_9TREE|nr:uncharacterized protein CcaverHIS019_0306210 [Cutaneotrichosporon cavernicola]BEI90551.1 hypothetical protein CcaverHIS019_0306210 [Cutaneotrichosporon cavernicola]BEI98325.1 hypothetical protein CcaverHIS631_0306240 [Cutaneotrichosporon cavernicola]BEJ06101.1 hypothetical protein CcaverHIS641_0306230 [Cutaneotrichosporon cavernicola]